MTTNRRKKAVPKLRKVNVSPKAQWRQILKDIDKDDIPVDLLLAITVNLIDGTQVNIDVKELLDAGGNPDNLGELLDKKFIALNVFIKDIDFYINIDNVVRTVQPITDQILKDL